MRGLLWQRNFALLWWGGLISLTGNRVLAVALPFYVYEQTGSTLATATMVIATIVPSLLVSSIAGVLVDRWDRRRVMGVTNLLLALVLLPLFAIPATGWVWLVYLVAFVETLVAIFFRLAENALLPQLVAPDQLLRANALNALNDTIARLVGPALGGLLLAFGGLTSVVTFDSISYLLAGLLIFCVNASPQQTRPRLLPAAPAALSWHSFRHEWQDGLALIRRQRIIALLFIVIGLTTFGGTMMDPLYAPFVHDSLQADATTFGWLLTMQGLGGVLGGFLISWWANRLNPTFLFGLSAIAVGFVLLLLFQSTVLPFVFGLALVAGIPSVGARVGMQTLLQENIADAYRGRVGGLLTTVGSLLELVSVGMAGFLAEAVGIVFMLSLAATLTMLAGVLGLYLLPAGLRQ